MVCLLPSGGATLRGSDRVCPHVFSRRCTRARAHTRRGTRARADARAETARRTVACTSVRAIAPVGHRREVTVGATCTEVSIWYMLLGVLQGWAMANYAAELHAVYDAFNSSVPPTHWHSHDGSVPPGSAPVAPRPLYSAAQHSAAQHSTAQHSTQNELRRARRPRPRTHAHAHWRTNAADTPPTHARARSRVP